MTGLIVLPILLPALTAPFLILALGYDLRAQRVASIGATVLFLALAVTLYALAGDGPPRTYRLGDWPAPFGIVLVLDRLAATMLVLTGVLTSVVVVHAADGWDARGGGALRAVAGASGRPVIGSSSSSSSSSAGSDSSRASTSLSSSISPSLVGSAVGRSSG